MAMLEQKANVSINIGRVWSQNAINAKVKKLSYPREKIDDSRANTIPLPFVCNMCCTHVIYHIFQTNGSVIVFACLSSIFSPGTLNFFTLAFIAFCDQTHHLHW